MEFLKEIITSNSGMIFTVLLTVVLTIFSKMIISIFKMGTTFSKSLASKAEFESFKKEIRMDMRAYKEELTKNIMDTCFKLIDDKLKSIDDVNKLSTEMKATEAKWNEQIKNMDEKYGEIKTISQNITSIQRQLTNMNSAENITRRKD